ncbi:MAG: ATP synthase F1 subunit delta [Oscillospiraceae bacterium]|jgi:F-type H+-transporting ATPase subunit delta|nr:ATP synthase F1 subunit delta [Oscillospiraceae bacterium]
MPASIEKTYADALFSLIAEENETDRSVFDDALKELQVVDGLLSEVPDFLKLLGTPTVPKESKLKIVGDAFEGRVSGYVYNFLRVLTVKGRMSRFKGVYRAFRELYNERFAIAEVTVTTRAALSDALRSKITSRMAQITGKSVVLKEKVEPAIIGGIVLDYGNTRMDGSVKTRLAELKKDISGIIA